MRYHQFIFRNQICPNCSSPLYFNTECPGYSILTSVDENKDPVYKTLMCMEGCDGAVTSDCDTCSYRGKYPVDPRALQHYPDTDTTSQYLIDTYNAYRALTRTEEPDILAFEELVQCKED